MARTLISVALLTVFLSSCAPATPTIDPSQIQASAVAAASTMIAQTVAAAPTATPIPPTDTPSPTLPPPPTLAPLPTMTTPTTAAAAGDCNQLMDVAASGPKSPVAIKNLTKGPITVTMGVSTKNAFGQCGYMSWGNISKGDTITVSVPQVRTNLGDACYWVYVWINDPKHTGTVSNSGFCIDNQLKWTVNVSYDKVTLTPP